MGADGALLVRVLTEGVHVAAHAYLADRGRLPERPAPDLVSQSAGGYEISDEAAVDWHRVVLTGLTLTDSPAVRAALSTLDDLLHPEWTGSALGAGRPNLVRTLLGRLADTALPHVGDVPASADDLVGSMASEVERLHAFCIAEELVAGYAVPLVGLSAPAGVRWVDEHFRVRGVDAAYRRSIWQRIASLGSRRLEPTMMVHDLELVGAQLEMVAAFPPGGHLDMRLVQHRWTQAVDVVRLASRGAVYPLCEYSFADEHEPYIDSVVMGGIGHQLGWRPRPAEVIPIGAAVDDLWRRLTTIGAELDGGEAARLERALQRFRFAYDRTSAEDRLIDCWIALEALVLSDSRQELGYKAALRIARLVERDPAKRRELFARVKALYTARSKVAHGTTLHDAPALADEVHDVLRRVLVAWLAPDATRSPAAMDAALLG